MKAICVVTENKLRATESEHSNPRMNANWPLPPEDMFTGRRKMDEDTKLSQQTAMKKIRKF